MRPKLDKLPRGKWSCAYCIADVRAFDKHKSFAIQSLTHGLQSVAKGDKEAARKAVAAMKSISFRGGAKKGQQLSPPRNEQEAAEVSSPTAQQTSSNDGVVIVRSGRRYFVKQKVTVVNCTAYSFCHSHGFSVLQLTTLGKFDTLDEAIQAYHAQTNKTPR